jgi:hypothetical protein
MNGQAPGRTSVLLRAIAASTASVDAKSMKATPDGMFYFFKKFETSSHAQNSNGLGVPPIVIVLGCLAK